MSCIRKNSFMSWRIDYTGVYLIKHRDKSVWSFSLRESCLPVNKGTHHFCWKTILLQRETLFFTKGEAALLLVKRPGDCKWHPSWLGMYPLDNPADLATKLRKLKKNTLIFCFQSVFKDFSNSERCLTANGASCSPLVVGAWQAAASLLCWAEQRQNQGKIRKTITCMQEELGMNRVECEKQRKSWEGMGVSCLSVRPIFYHI